MMRLSDAILLGSTVLEPKAGQQHYSELNAGCALGMAAVAAGYSFRPVSEPFDERDRRTLGTEVVWGNWVLETVRRPCNCWRLRVPREMRIKDIIAHLFDRHVMSRKNWTLEQLSAWVESVEPKLKTERVAESELCSGDARSDWQMSPHKQFEPSHDGNEEWQAIRRAYEGQSNASRKRPRFQRKLG